MVLPLPTIAEEFALALHHHRAGNLLDAIACYQRVLLLQPDHLDAQNNLGAAFMDSGRLDEAVVCFRQSLRLKPDFAAACTNLGNALSQQGKLDEAIAAYRQGLDLNPNLKEAHFNLANALKRQNKIDEAIGSYRQAVRLDPQYVAAHNNLGAALKECGRLEEAAASFLLAVQVGQSHEAYTNLGVVLMQLGRLEEAVACHRQALRLQPNLAALHINLASCLAHQGKLEEAARSLQQVLLAKLEFGPACVIMGYLCVQQRQFEQALAWFERALREDDGDAEAHFNRAMLWLLLGNWSQGWPEYKWRWQTSRFAQITFEQSRWDGSPLAGRTLLVLAEQGLGDTIQFVRYLPLVKQQGGRVILQCQPQLLHLLAAARGIDHLVPKGAQLPPFDVYVPLLELPDIFQTSLENIPAAAAYLQTDPKLVAHWKGELEPLQGFRIGIAWQGSPTYRGDLQRSIPLMQFAPLARLEGVRLISLQKGPGTEQLKDEACRFPVLDLGSRLDTAAGAFMDTAAVMKTLDLVIASDSAVAHLAGALGVPVWVALPLVPDWRWLLDREDTPWYPTMRLFRQTQRGNWENVFARMAAEWKRVTEGGVGKHIT